MVGAPIVQGSTLCKWLYERLDRWHSDSARRWRFVVKYHVWGSVCPSCSENNCVVICSRLEKAIFTVKGTAALFPRRVTMPAGGQVAPLSLLLISTPSCLAWPQNTGYSDREAPNSWCTSKCFLRLEIEDEWVCCWTRRVNCTLIPYRCNIWYTSTCCCDAFWLHVAGGQQHKFACCPVFVSRLLFFFRPFVVCNEG